MKAVSINVVYCTKIVWMSLQADNNKHTRSICRWNNYRLNRNKDGKEIIAHAPPPPLPHTHTYTQYIKDGGGFKDKAGYILHTSAHPLHSTAVPRTEEKYLQVLNDKKKGRKEV